MIGFALRGRWLVGHVVVLAVAALSVRLGLWQLERLDQVRERNALVETRRAMPVAPLEEVLSPRESDPASAAHRRVTAEGRYDPEGQVLVPFRSLDGRPGGYLLTPLVTPGGGAVMVNRGWVPATDAEAIPLVARPPAGHVRVRGIALAAEPERGRVTQRIAGRVAGITRIDLAELERDGRHDLFPVHVQLLDQAPAPAALPRPIPPAPLDEGPHLSYAFQWFTFAAIGLLGWPLLVRRAGREWERPKGTADAQAGEQRRGPR